MMISLIKSHLGLFVLSALTAMSTLLLSTGNGLAKPAADIAWLDVVGEGSVVVFTLLWILAALASRPPGKVTRLLVIGLNCFLFSASLDFLDEFYHYSEAATWLSMVESIPAALGMVVMSVALYGWHQEQLALNRQLQRREWWHRSHDQIDVITQLYRGDYWRARAQACQQQGQDACIVVLDINGFSRFNQRYGHKEGDRFLKEMAQLIVMNLRSVDLACRYAGDRFALLLPGLSKVEAVELTQQLCKSIHNVAFRSGGQSTAIYQSARTAIAHLTADSELDTVLCQLHQQLDDSARKVA